MKLVVDANILFAALARNGLTAKLCFSKSIQLCAPEFILQELEKHSQTLRKKFNGTDEEFEKMKNLLLKQVELISDETLIPFTPAAASLITDKKDWLYLACALKENADIWTHDAGFKEQKRVKVWTTEKLAEEVGKL